MSTKAQRARTGKFWMIPDSLSHSAGTITANLNGKIYTLVLSGLTANNLYYIYFLPGVGLVFTTSIPSSFSDSRILIGAFYANSFSPVSFGSFVTIEGRPATVNEILDGGTLASFFAGFSAFTLTGYNWSRNGTLITVDWRLDAVTGNAVSGRVPLPRGGLISSNTNSGPIGTYAGQNGSGNAGGGSMIGLGSSDVGFSGNNLAGQALSLQVGTVIAGTAPTTLAGQFRTHITQWSAMPLKDL